MPRFVRFLALLAAAAITPTVAAAQTPNFSGTWVLDAAKSDLGPMAQMMGGQTPNITMVIEHKEPTVVMKTTTETPRGARTQEQTLTTNGSPVTTQGARGGSMTTSAKWNGTALVVTTTRETPNGALTTEQTIVLGADGKTLAVDTKAQTPMGEFTTSQVFNRQN